MQPQQPYMPNPQQPAPPPGPLPGQNAGGPQPDYGFIMEPQQPKRPLLFNFGNTSAKMRLAIIAGGIVLLLILVVGFKNMLAGSNVSVPTLVSVVQDQQALVHLATNGVQNAVAGDTTNFAVTAQAVLQSQENETIDYLKTNHHKLSGKELLLKVSKTTDAQLANALTTNSYDSTFKDSMKTGLITYQHDLQQAYAHNKGPKGRAMLNDDYSAASLLLKQLGS